MTDQIDTNNSYPLYSEDHPKYGSTKNVVPTIRVPEEAHTNAAPQGLGLDNFASDIAAKYHAQRNVRKHSRAGPDFREFLQKRNQRQDSQATLVDFARRPSRTNEGKDLGHHVVDQQTRDPGVRTARQILVPQHLSKQVLVYMEVNGVHSAGGQTSIPYNQLTRNFRDWTPMQPLWILVHGGEARVNRLVQDLVQDP
ncbi:hypothetical protein KCV05_g20907, partial [Aureobasidium melanogenum]